jgi:hypothetical protein
MREVIVPVEERVSDLELEIAHIKNAIREEEFELRKRALDLEFDRLAFDKERHKDVMELEWHKINSNKLTFSRDVGGYSHDKS